MEKLTSITLVTPTPGKIKKISLTLVHINNICWQEQGIWRPGLILVWLDELVNKNFTILNTLWSSDAIWCDRALRLSDSYVNVVIIIGSDNGLSPGRRQAIIWTNAGILLIGPLGTNFSEILIEI